MNPLRPALAGVLLCFATALPLLASAAAVTIDKVIPFARADAVRIETVLQAEQTLAGLELSATITHAKTGAALWQGTLARTNLAAGAPLGLSLSVSNLTPELWSPVAPVLYDLKLTGRRGTEVLAEKTVRFGFRIFESRHGQFYLNGRPLFLRGLAINPPGRTVPPAVGESRPFAEAYVRFMKSQNLNTLRFTHDSQVWFDVCDELGMLVYQGQYGSPLESDEGKQRPPTDFNRSLAAYRQLFETYAPHPSILIYILANELPVSGTRGKAFHDFLSRAHAALKSWDDTRLYIGNAGYGEGREGDICDVHRYWGWYYNTFLTYYNLRDPQLYGDPSKNQPLTFTECVGNFTGPRGDYNLVVRKQLGAQLNWTGHAANQREEALRYQAFMVKQATETFRRLRPLNPRLAGIMPFTILFKNWSGITAFEQMQPKPAMDQLAAAYQPVLLSWELWTPQVYAGASLHPLAHVINDADDGSALTNAVLVWRLEDSAGAEVSRSELKLPPIPYYGTWSQRLDLNLSSELPTGDYRLVGSIQVGDLTVSQNDTELFVAGADWEPAVPETLDQPVVLYDPPGRTAAALQKLQVPFQPLRDWAQWPPPARILVIGEGAWDPAIAAAASKLKAFSQTGGRILCLQQGATPFDPAWLPEPVSGFTASANDPAYPPASRPFSGNMNLNLERPAHLVFQGLDCRRLALWSDYTVWDQTKPGFPRLYPVTAGFKLQQADSLARTAILADYDRGLEGVALCEMFAAEGSVILSALDLVARVGLDPAADRLLKNLVRYAASKQPHKAHPLITRPIKWGNYAAEYGLVTGPLNGLVVNADWVRPPTDRSAKPLTQAEGAWNTRPGDQFVPHGRSPFGPYGYTTASSLKDLAPESPVGTGRFWARIPNGKTSMVTQVQNPVETPGKLTIAINGKVSVEDLALAPGKSQSITTPLPAGTTDLEVRYTGTKTLVLLETSFR